MKTKFILLLILLAVAFTLLQGCATRQVVQVAEHQTRDTIYLNRTQYDSISLRDSCVMDYRPSNAIVRLPDSLHLLRIDTVIIRHKTVEYRYRLLRDTIYKSHTDSIPVIQTVEVTKEVERIPWWSQLLGWTALLLLLAILLRNLKTLKT